MRSVSLRLVDLERKPLIPLGFEGENEYMTINFDCKTVFDKHPAAVPTLAVTPPQGDSYPAVVVRDGDIVSWTVCDSDLVCPGEGVLQLTFVDGTIIGKTYKARTKVLDSITPSGEAPTPIQNWLIQAAAALQALPQEVSNAVVALMGEMVGVGETLDPGENVTVSYDVENNALTIGVPRGADGHSPAITANKVGKVATFYVDGLAVVQISDGQDADPTELIDDTSTAQNRTWSADKLHDEIVGKADKADTVLSTTLSRGRTANSIIGEGSFAFGNNVTASGAYSHAEGGRAKIYYGSLYFNPVASGDRSHAENGGTTASGKDSHAEGEATTASGVGSHAEGYYSVASGLFSHAEGGRESIGTGLNMQIRYPTASGENSHAENGGTIASGKDSHAEGHFTEATGDHSHAEGYRTKSIQVGAHAEGILTKADGVYAHAEGRGTASFGNESHVEGNYSVAYGYYSHSEGNYTKATHRSQHVFGEYNIEDPSEEEASEKGTFVEIVGNGTASNAKSNARTLDWEGNEVLAGDLTVKKGTADEISVSALKTEINSRPETKNTTESDSDVDVTDENGNVIVRFAHGDVQTKNFNSSKIAGIKLTTDISADFDLVDVMGNVLTRFSGGHILTKNFDSSNIVANGYLKGKVIVNFGDSIFGNKRPPKDISTTIANETGATVYNCGFGGCRMAKHDSSRLSTWGKFSMWELADAIASNDFTGQESAIENFPVSEMPSYFPETLALLESIDFSTVDIVTIAYGTNDFTASVLVDDENDKYSTSTFAGALRYSIETLLGAFPNLRIVCCGQCYRWWDNAGVFVDDSNTHEVGGQLLTQFVSKTEDVAKEYNLQFINNYNIGIGKFTRGYFFTGTDTTHPNDIGTKLIARHIVRELY